MHSRVTSTIVRHADAENSHTTAWRAMRTTSSRRRTANSSVQVYTIWSKKKTWFIGFVISVLPNPCKLGEPLLTAAKEPVICGGTETCPAGYWWVEWERSCKRTSCTLPSLHTHTRFFFFSPTISSKSGCELQKKDPVEETINCRCHVGGSPETTNCCPGCQSAFFLFVIKEILFISSTPPLWSATRSRLRQREARKACVIHCYSILNEFLQVVLRWRHSDVSTFRLQGKGWKFQ